MQMRPLEPPDIHHLSTAMGWLELDNLMYQSDVPAVDFSKWFKFQQALQLMSSYGTVQNPNIPGATLSWTDVWNQLLNGSGQAAISVKGAMIRARSGLCLRAASEGLKPAERGRPSRMGCTAVCAIRTASDRPWARPRRTASDR